RWTRLPVTRELALGAGFFFAPGVPALAAAAGTLAGAALASYALFRGVEAALGRWIATPERQRHLTLALAAFAAFNLFYLFAGAPTLRKIPYGTRALAFVAPAVAVLVLARRWGRSRAAYIRDKGAVKLLRNWPFAGPPPADPIEAYARVQASEQAREQLIAGYVQTLRDVLADGVVDESEMRLLEEIRRQFGITPREHERVVAQLAEEERELLASGRVATVEERLQLEGYRAALTEALLRGAGDGEIDALRRAFGVLVEDHAALAERLRGGAGPLVERARRELAEASARRADRLALGDPHAAREESLELLAFLLARGEEASLARVFELLALLGDAAEPTRQRPAPAGADLASRRQAVARLREACPDAAELLAELAPFVDAAAAPAATAPAAERRERLARLAVDADPFVRAAAVWSLAAAGPEAAPALAAARADGDAMVREAAAAGSGAAAGFAGRSRIAQMQALRRVPLFAELDPDDLFDLAELAREEELTADAALCEQGAPDAGDLFVVLAGRAAVSVRDEASGGERELAELGPGEMVGELALLDGSPRSATVRAKGGPLVVLRIAAPAFRERLLPRGRVARALLSTLARRLRDAAHRAATPPPSAPRSG
ncbi:MAG: cyclic nucleotide-binding domain-containing protein, partial [Thermoanaerobaculia bacterium]|nr:cyclic nucleotide-binding domain-containing protein [Thermoanaerobaculia bacterium]